METDGSEHPGVEPVAAKLPFSQSCNDGLRILASIIARRHVHICKKALPGQSLAAKRILPHTKHRQARKEEARAKIHIQPFTVRSHR